MIRRPLRLSAANPSREITSGEISTSVVTSHQSGPPKGVAIPT
jgi:hypothetical protein